MSTFFLSLLLLAAPAPTQSPPKAATPPRTAPPPGGAAAPNAAPNPVAIAAQNADRCAAGFAVRLTTTNLSDDVIYTVANTMCQPLFDDLVAKINANVPKPKADEIIGKMTSGRRAAFGALLKAVREGRAAGKIK